MQGVDVETRLSRQCNCDERHHDQHVAADSMILVQCLCVVHAAIDLRSVELGETDQGLDDEEDVGDEAHDAVG